MQRNHDQQRTSISIGREVLHLMGIRPFKNSERLSLRTDLCHNDEKDGERNPTALGRESAQEQEHTKKLQTRFGKIELSNNHVLAQSPSSINISSYAQEATCYVGQYSVFEEPEKLTNNFMGAGFNAKQIERACHRHGQSMEEEDLHNIKVNCHEEIPPAQAGKLHYISVDGSMYLTRKRRLEGNKTGKDIWATGYCPDPQDQDNTGKLPIRGTFCQNAA